MNGWVKESTVLTEVFLGLELELAGESVFLLLKVSNRRLLCLKAKLNIISQNFVFI